MKPEQILSGKENKLSEKEELGRAMSFEKDLLCRFREGRLAKIAVAFSLVTAMAAASIEKAYSADSPSEREKVEDFFDLSGPAKSNSDPKGNARNFMVEVSEIARDMNTNPAEKVEIGTPEIDFDMGEEDDPNNYIRKDGQGNVQSRNIGGIR